MSDWYLNKTPPVGVAVGEANGKLWIETYRGFGIGQPKSELVFSGFDIYGKLSVIADLVEQRFIVRIFWMERLPVARVGIERHFVDSLFVIGNQH